VNAFIFVSMCVRVDDLKKERDMYSVCLCVCACVYACVCVRVCDRERDSFGVMCEMCMCTCVCVRVYT